jgi:hypothetical protein
MSTRNSWRRAPPIQRRVRRCRRGKILGMSTALIIVDIQNDCLTGGCRSPRSSGRPRMRDGLRRRTPSNKHFTTY